MPIDASRLARRAAASHVFSVRHGLEVSWIHTGAVAAKMVKGQSFRYLPDVQFVTEPMRNPHPPTNPEMSVAITVG